MSDYNINNGYYKRMCEKVGCDFKTWLNQKYNIEKLNSRDLAELAYGKRKNGPNITVWMKKLNVPVRSRSEAIELQWVDNDERKKKQAINTIKTMGVGTQGRKKLIEIMQTDDYKAKIKKANSGENNGMWNPDLSDSERKKQRLHSRRFPGYKDFRKSVYERDNYTCLKCGDNKGGNLVVHHLNGFHWDENSRTEVDNGVTLCNDCHNRFHYIYGRKWNDLFQFSQYMDEIKVNPSVISQH